MPRSMSEAAEQFLNVPGGNLAKWSAAQRTELAERNTKAAEQRHALESPSDGSEDKFRRKMNGAAGRRFKAKSAMETD
ncbi:MAG TPA: hypothetical protein VI386_26260 [Candidatus Sulfotelmatobacter sp.]